MSSKFGGIEIVEEQTSRFGGVPVEPVVEPVQGQPSLLERAQRIYGKRAANIGQITGGAYPDQTIAEDVLQTAGQVAGGVGDVAGEVIGDVVGAVTPESVKQYLSTQAAEITQDPTVQEGAAWLGKGVEAYKQWAESNPRLARNFEAVVDVGLFGVPAAKAGTAGVKAGAKGAGIAGELIGEAAESQANKIKADFVQGLVEPKITPTVAAERAKRTVGSGFIGKGKVVPTAQERNMAEAVFNVKGVSNNKTLQQNLELVQKEAAQEAETLKSLLKQNEVIFPRREFASRLSAAKERLGESAYLTGDAQKSAQKILDKMQQIVSSKPSNASGLLEARKDLDKWIKKQKPKAFDANKEGAFDLALKEIRNTTNNFIDEKAVNVAVKDSLKKQAALFGAADNIAPKAAAESSSALRRLVDSVPLKGDSAKILAGAAAAAGTGMMPSLAAAGLGGLATVKAVQVLGGPKFKFALSKLLKGTDDLINRTGDAARKEQLMRDKELVKSILGKSKDKDVK